MAEPARDRVAVVGAGCRLPGGVDSLATLWSLLLEGRDAVRAMPPGRFDAQRFLGEPRAPGKIATTEGGFLLDIDKFDAPFFRLSAREAAKMDPQHRLLLEVTWEALEDGGIVPRDIAGRRVGVYMGIWAGEYENVLYRTPEELDFHSITGGGRYAASGRVAYALDLRGPCLTVDTGCSSALVALHLADQALQAGEIELAIVGAANLILQPHVNIGYSRSGMLSAGGRCRFGSAAPSGYVRSDGVAAVVLQRLEDARAAENRVRALILGSAVNADGQGSGQLATPSEEAQAQLLELVYRESGVDPQRVGYVEAHGTGTTAGDPVELGAIGQVLGRGRPADEPLFVGSVKTNIGHTEATAGLAGMLKALLAVQHRTIPASLHSLPRNDKIDWEGSRLVIPAETIPWPSRAGRIAGVSSFGITGTNAHVILEGVDDEEKAGDPSVAEPREMVVCLSANTHEGLTEGARRLAAHIDECASLRLSDLAYTANCRRTHHEHRLAATVESLGGLREALRDVANGGTPSRVVHGVARRAGAPRVGFVFSGQGSQWKGMGRELMSWAPDFARSIADSDRILGSMVDWSLDGVLAGTELLDTIDVIQPALGAVQIALAEQLRAWGVRPWAVAGHSMGELAAACVAGALSQEEALRALVVRSDLLRRIAGAGAMALVDEAASAVQSRLEQFGGRLSIAAINGPRSTVVSGDPSAADSLLAQLEGEGVFCRKVRVDVASHSAQTDPLLPDLRRSLDGLRPSEPQVHFFSTVLGDLAGGIPLDAEYWVRNLRSPVQLHGAVRRMIEHGADLLVEIAPHPILLTSLGDIAASGEQPIATRGLLRREEPEVFRMLEAVAGLYVEGCDVDWRNVQPSDGRLVTLPTYPWQRERLWIDRWEDWSGDQTVRSVAWPEEADGLLYRVEWEEAGARANAGSGAATPGRWLVVGPNTPLVDAVERNWLARGHPVDRVTASGTGSPREEIRRAIHGSDQPLRGVIIVGGLPANGGPADAALQACWLVAQTVQEALDRSSDRIRLVLVTSGAVAVHDGDAVNSSGLADSGLWGFGRVVRDENPELEVRIVDVDPEAAAGPSASAVFAAALGDSAEPECALRNGTTFVPRLVRVAPPPEQKGRGHWPTDGATLITGGLGDLGLAAARHLVARGVHRLILVSRRGLPPRKDWPGADPATEVGRRVATVMEMEAHGAAVHLASVDVGDAAQLRSFLEGYASEAWPPIRAVIHTAGVIDSHLVRSMTKDALERAFEGKARGAWNLHQAFPDVSRFVSFSSTAALLPQAGDANYAAANAFLDALTQLRSSAGQDGQAVNWGVWADLGIARMAGARYVEQVRRQGVGALNPDTAIQILDRVAASGERQLLVAPIDWATLRANRGSTLFGPLFQKILDDGTDGLAGGNGLESLRATPPDGRLGRVEDLLREIASKVLGVAEDRVKLGATLGSQGLDSLMALELRNHVEVMFDLKVSATLAWNYPTIPKLAAYILERCRPAIDSNSTDPGASPVVHDGVEHESGNEGREWPKDEVLARHLSQVDALSDEAVLRELRGEA